MKFNKFVLIRRCVACLCLLFISMSFFWETGDPLFIALSRLQFGQIFLDAPALMLALCFLVLLSCALFGRIYCSVLCPLGIFQDIAGSLSKRLHGKKYCFSGLPGNVRFKAFRRLLLLLLAALFILGAPSLLSLADPYSIYIRGASRLSDHAVGLITDTLSPVLKSFGIYPTYAPGDFHVVSVAVFVLLFFAAFFRGRLFCNTLCPVGLVLGCISQYQTVRPAFKDNCIACGKCASVCKAECINVPDKSIDTGRCVMCGNCVAACPVAAMAFTQSGFEHNREKRATIKLMTLVAAFTALPLIKQLLSPLSALTGKIKGNILHPQIPAGAMSWARFLDKCAGCHACIKRCPSQALKPANMDFGVSGLLKPVLSFDRGFCQYDCVLCGQICPFGAITPLAVKEKHKIQTGVATYARELCVITTKGERCGACAEHCPTGALEMIAVGPGQDPLPTIIPELCVGCGACEYICPVTPHKAVFIQPLAIHQTAEILQRQDSNTEETNSGFMF